MPASFNCTILIDDDQISNYITEKIIKKFKISEHIKIAFNGLDGLQIVLDTAKNNLNCNILVLLDLNMPVMSGLEFLKEFSTYAVEIKNQVKIVVLTTSSHESDMAKVEKYQIQGYINKPFTEEKLKSILERI